MLRIRFQRVGKRNQPFFRIVVTERTSPPQGGKFEKVGFFNPLTKEKALKVERIKYWLSVGAKPSDRVYNLLVEEKVIEGKKKAVQARKKQKVAEEGEGKTEGSSEVKSQGSPASSSESEDSEPKSEKKSPENPEAKSKGKSDEKAEEEPVKKPTEEKKN